jgi:AcrR family transcriptional regulator
VKPRAPRAAAPLRRRQEERSTETRERLIMAAVECIEQVGYIEATTAVIAEHAGQSRGALQHHFASRADLIVAVIDRVASELNFSIDVESLATERLEARVEALVDRYWAVFMGPLFRAVLNITLGVSGEPALAARLRLRLDEARAGYVAIWHDLFRDVGCTDAELSATFHVVMSAARGFGVLKTFQPDADWDEHRRKLCAITARELHRLSGQE